MCYIIYAADIRYRHEACSVYHQGDLPLESAALSPLLLIIHVPFRRSAEDWHP